MPRIESKKKWCSTYLFAVIAALIVVLMMKFQLFSKLEKRGFHFKAEQSSSFVESNSTVSNLSLFKVKNVSEENTQVVPISAYYDARSQHSHNNSTIILASVLQTIFKHNSIAGCEVDGVTRYKPMMSAKTIAVSDWIQSHHPVSHLDIIVTCFDLYIDENSTVNILYKDKGSEVRVAVKNAVVMPPHGAEQDGVMICSTGYGTPTYLDQWLVYQQTIGVKFIHLNVHNSFVNNINKSDHLKKFISSGYVKMIVWKEYLDKSQVFLYSQSLKYQDCILRYQHAYKYIMIVDFDEYFIPLGVETNVGFYAKSLFSRSHVGSVALPDIRYYCKTKTSPNAAPPLDGNVTKLYDTTQYTKQGSKSIHLLKVVEEASVHEVASLIPPYTRVTYRFPDKSKCYISHITKYDSYTKKCKS